MKNTLKSKDSLLEQFKNYKIDMKLIHGGLKVNGGMQNGGNSYIDVTYDDGSQACDVLASTHDKAGWIDHIYDNNRIVKN